MDNTDIIRCMKCYYVWHHCICPQIIAINEIKTKPIAIICHVCNKNVVQCICCNQCRRAKCVCHH